MFTIVSVSLFALCAAVAALAGDGGLLLLAAAPAAASEETLKELKRKIEKVVDPEDGLVKKVREMEKYQADMKQKVQNRCQEIADKVDEVKEAEEKRRQKIKEELHERLDDLAMASSNGRGGKRGLAQNVKSALKESRIGSEINSNSGANESASVNFGMGVKDIVDAPGDAAEGITPTERIPDISTEPRRTPQVTDLLPVEPVGTGSVDFVQEVATPNDVGSQGNQGDALPQSEYRFEEKTASIETIGHHVPVALQLLDDVERLESVIRRVMDTDLQNKVDRKALLDDGTSGQLDGLVPNSRAYDPNLEAEIVDSGGNATVTDLDRIMVGITQLTRDSFSPTGIILSSLNWSAIQLIKDNEGRYVFVQPQSESSPRLFGLPVADTNALPEGSAHIGAYEQAAQIADREESGVQVSTEHADNFTKLRATLRVYVRLQVLVRRPNGLISIDDELDAQAPTAGS